MLSPVIHESVHKNPLLDDFFEFLLIVDKLSIMVVGHDYGAALGGQVENVSEVVLTYEILAAHNVNV